MIRKNIKLIFAGIVIASVILGAGCSNVNENRVLNSNGVTKIVDGYYVTPVYVARGASGSGGDYLYFRCDENGNIYKGEAPISVGEQSGKTTYSVSVVDVSQTKETPMGDNYKYTFKCNNLEECKVKIKIVEETLNKN